MENFGFMARLIVIIGSCYRPRREDLENNSEIVGNKF